MNISRTASFLLFVALGAAGLGCGGGPTFNMPNPLVSGAVPPNTILYRDRFSENANGLPPGTLTDEASLVAVSDKEVCFNVKIRTARKDLSSLKGWRAFLRGKPSFENMSPVVKEQARVEDEVVGGSVLVTAQSNQQVCDNTGYCYSRTISSSSRIPQDVHVLTGGGMVCFGNGGQINKATEEFTFHMDDPSPPAAGMWTGLFGRITFRWKFN